MSQQELIKGAVQRLDKKNLTDLWLTHSVLSLVEYFGDNSGVCPLSPLLNLKVVSLFGDAILRSEASEDGEDLFLPSDIAPILNPLLEAEDLGAVDGDINDPEERLLHWISVMASSQARFQSNDLGPRIARTFAMLAILPDLHEQRLREKHGSHFLHLPDVFEDRFGLGVHAFFQSAFRLFLFYKMRHDDLRLSTSIWSKLSGVDRGSDQGLRLVNDVFHALVDQSKSIYASLVTGPKALVLKDDPLPLQNLAAFFDVVARDTDELRALHSGPAAQKGFYGHQLSPLEMYPVIELLSDPSDAAFVVPDFRKFDIGITQVPHFALMREFPSNEYNELLGSLQEIYIEDLTGSRLDAISVIPEQIYGKPDKHGPDLTVVDHRVNGLVCIESKGKRFRVDSKVNPYSAELLADLRSGMNALKKLPEKIEALYSGLPEYADHQPTLNNTKSKQPICVIVLGEGVFALPHVVTSLLDKESGHFIHSFPYPYCIMSLEIYERAVEVTAAHGMSFYDTLFSYWKTGTDKSPKQHAAEDFGGLQIDRENWYLGRYKDQILKTPEA